MTTYSEIQTLLGSGTSVDLPDDEASITLEQALTLADAGVTFGNGDVLVVSDTAANLQEINDDAIGKIKELGVSLIKATDSALTLSLAQVNALAAADIGAGYSSGEYGWSSDSDTKVATTSQTYDSNLTALTGGGYVVTWSSYDSSQSGYVNYFELLNSDGTAAGEPTVISSTSSNGGWAATETTALANGGFAVVWTDFATNKIKLGTYSADGVSNLVMTVGDTSSQYSYSYNEVDVLPNGNMVVSWTNYSKDGSGLGVYMKIIDGSGSDVLGETRVNNFTTSDQYSQKLVPLDNGSFAIVWTSDTQDGSGGGVFMKIYSATGAEILGETRVNEYTDQEQSTPHIAALADGGFAITWTSYEQDGSSYGVYTKVYDADGHVVKGETIVNETTNGEQYWSDVTALSDGGYVATWMSYSSSSSGWEIFTRQFGSDGAPVTGEVQVSPGGNNADIYPSVLALTNGGYAVAWYSYVQSKGWTPTVQVFDKDGDPIGEALPVSNEHAATDLGYGYGDDYGVNLVELDNGDIVVAWGSSDGVYTQTFEVGVEAASLSEPADTVSALTASDVADLVELGVKTIHVTDAGDVTLSSDLATSLIGITGLKIVEAASVTVSAEGGALDDFGAGEIAKLDAIGVTNFDATDNAATITLAQSDALVSANIAFAADDVVTLELTSTDLVAIESTGVSNLHDIGVDVLDLTDDMATISAEKAQSLVTAGISSADGDAITVSGTASDLGEFIASYAAGDATLVDTFDITDDSAVSLTVAQWRSLADLGAGFAEGDSVMIADGWEGLDTLTPNDIDSLAGYGVKEITFTGGSTNIDGDVVREMAYKGLSFSFDSSLVRMTVSAEDISGLSADSISELAMVKFDAFYVEDAATISLTQLNALADHDLSIYSTGVLTLSVSVSEAESYNAIAKSHAAAVGVDSLEITDTAAELAKLAGLSPDTMTALSGAVLNVVGGEGDFTLAQANSLTQAGFTFVAGNDITASVSLTEAKELTGQTSGLLHLNGVDVIELDASPADIKALTTTEIAALGVAGVNVVDLDPDRVVLSAAQVAAFSAAGISFSESDTVVEYVNLQLKKDAATVTEHTTARLDVTANDVVTDGFEIDVTNAVVSSGSGVVTLNDDGTLSVAYTGKDLDGSATSVVEVTYTATDGESTTTAQLSVTFTATAEDGDDIIGTPQADKLNGTGVGERIFGRGANDVIHGNGGNDALYGEAGKDTLYGGSGDDTLDGGDGNDALDGGTGNDLLNGAIGNDALKGGDGNDALYGKAGQDTLNGGAGDDILKGGADNDTLFGGAGKDTFYFRAGSDTASGGSGADTFIFSQDIGRNRDTITDFDARGADHDVLDISDFDVSSFKALKAMMVDTGDDVVISLPHRETIVLKDVSIVDLDKGDFLL